MRKGFGIASFIGGLYLLFVGLLILDLEVSCGIKNMPFIAGFKLSFLFIVGVVLVFMGIHFLLEEV